jgi:hypothetical protein
VDISQNEKYVVFYRDGWEQWKQERVSDIGAINPDEVEDAVVIRRQDVFAPPALDAYANAITVALELIVEGVSSSDRAKRLRHIADYFHQQAELAWNTERKVPD